MKFLEKGNSILRKVMGGSLLILFMLSISLSLKLLTFDIYKIPSSSMEKTLLTNDVILVNKLKYGPKLPRSPFEIPWVNIAFYFRKEARKSIRDNWWSYKRLSGTTNIKNGDIMVFDMFDQKMIIVKRCMAIAGDTLKIINGNVFVNGKFFNPSELINNNYQFGARDKAQLFKLSDSLGVNIHFNGNNKNRLEATLSVKEKNELESIALIDSVKISIDTLPVKYPEAKQLKWTLDNYGPYVIPKRGMTLDMHQKNFDLYSKAINDHEDSFIEEVNGDYYLNGEKINKYTFKHNYYFMMGDNRKGSQDSRYWGLVPENRIIGKVQCILFSNYENEFQWKRLFKAIN